MIITAEHIGKKFGRNSIFTKLNHVFQPNSITAVLGSNGSGKSTLLRVLSGQMDCDEGKISYLQGRVSRDAFFRYVGYTAPYIDLPEEFTFKELLRFHAHFKAHSLPLVQIPEACGLDKAAHIAIKEYSSGMKQRVKLSLNLFFQHKAHLFDEPCAHLDQAGYEWFNHQIAHMPSDCAVVIASNDPGEYLQASEEIRMELFKNL